jgi:hypothetical protein
VILVIIMVNIDGNSKTNDISDNNHDDGYNDTCSNIYLVIIVQVIISSRDG